MDLVLQSLLPSASTIRFKEAVGAIIDRDDPSQIEWDKLEGLVFTCAGTSSAVFREYPFLLHKILPKHPPVSVISTVVSCRPECLVLLDAYRPEGQQRMDATPLGIACRSGCSLEVVRFIIGKMVQLRSEDKHKKTFSDFERDREGGLFATAGFDYTMSLDVMEVLVEEHPDGVLAIGDKVGKGSLIAQLLLMRRNHEPLSGNPQQDPDKYLEMLGIVLRKEISSDIPIPHAMMEVFTSTGKFDVASDEPKEKNARTGTEIITLQAQVGASLQSFRDVADTQRERTRDHMLLDEWSIVQHLQLVRAKWPRLFKDIDAHGRTILHIALSNPKNWKHTHSRTYGSEIVKYLLNEYPEAISVKDKQGRHPLQVAIENLCPCYELILEATPTSVLETACPRLGLYPFQITAKHPCITESQASLWTEMSYRMLKKAPTMASGLAAHPEPWIESDTYKEIQIAKMRREQENGRIAVLERRLEQLKLSYKLKGRDKEPTV